MRNLQKTDIEHSQYERPTEKWRCGWADEGRPCSMGPNRKGKCQVQTECRPANTGQRWICTRHTSRGGPCTDGPLPDGQCPHDLPPCQPTLGWRARRGWITRCAAALVFGWVLFAMTGSARFGFISPGELNFKHSTAVGGCGACHAAAGEKLSAWPRLAFDALRGASDDDAQIERCVRCHVEGGNSNAPHNSHATSHGGASESVAQTSGSGGWLVEAAATIVEPTRVACAQCHREHRGASSSLVELSDATCQACHQSRFGRFEEGHPSFERYPYVGATAIRFDHWKHAGRHFDARGEEFSCVRCHRPDLAGRRMLTADYDAGCSSCHNKGVVQTRVAFLELPTIDTEALQAVSTDPVVQAWPDEGTGELTPYMIALLVADEAAAAALNTLGERALEDLSDATLIEKKAVVRLMRAIRDLASDLVEDGHDALATRLSPLIDNPDDASGVRKLIGAIPADVVMQSVTRWFPGAPPGNDEAASNEPGDAKGGVVLPSEEDFDPDAWAPAGGWTRTGLTVEYVAPRHGDEFLQAWTQLWASVEASPSDQYRLLQRTEEAREELSRCTACHTVGGVLERVATAERRSESGSRSGRDSGRGAAVRTMVNWQTYDGVVPRHPLTQYAHEPHFSLGDREGCQTCHQPRAYSGTSTSSLAAAPALGFEPMTLQTCARCHNDDGAASSCQTCHRYHDESQQPRKMATFARKVAAAN